MFMVRVGFCSRRDMENLMNITDLYIFSQFYTSGGMCILIT
jgi:hypothetical protein